MYIFFLHLKVDQLKKFILQNGCLTKAVYLKSFSTHGFDSNHQSRVYDVRDHTNYSLNLIVPLLWLFSMVMV